MRIREATPADAPAIRAIVTDALAEFGFAVESTGADSDLDDVPVSYQRLGGSFRVLLDDDSAIVGCGGIYPMSGGVVELRKMYFRPAVRGRGHGRALLENLVAVARAGGHQRIVLETASNLTAAIALYQRFGFTEEQLPVHSCRCDRTFALDLR